MYEKAKPNKREYPNDCLKTGLISTSSICYYNRKRYDRSVSSVHIQILFYTTPIHKIVLTRNVTLIQDLIREDVLKNKLHASVSSFTLPSDLMYEVFIST